MGQTNEFILVVAAPFRKNAASSLSIKEFEFSLSFDLKWMSPREALNVCDMAVRSNLLKLDGDTLKPSFDVDAFDIPHGFKPSPTLFMDKSVVERIMDHIAAATDLDMREIAARINTRQQHLSDLVDIEIAALLVARELGCDIEPIYGQVYDMIIQDSR